MSKTKRDNAVWFARYWARRFYEGRGDCQQMWFYLILAEALEQGVKV